MSLIAFSAMAVLSFLEFFVYRDTWMKYEYEVDKDFSRYRHQGLVYFMKYFLMYLSYCSFCCSKLRINIDITVAMRCQCK